MNVGDWVYYWSQFAPRKTAIIDEDREFSYGEVNERCNRVANLLLQKGIAKGDRVAILSYNSHEFIEIYLAAAKIGAIFLPLNWRMAPPEITSILNDCSPNVLFFAEDFLDTARFLKDNLEHLKYLITLGEEYIPWAERYEDMEAHPSTEPAGFAMPESEDIQIMMYTSGTTGVPKGVMLSYRKTFFNALNANIFFKLIPNDIFLVSRPLFHSGGLLINSTPAFYKGATVIFKRRFTTQEFMDAIERYHVTIIEPSATFLNFLLKEYDTGLSGLKLLKSCYTGGERVPETMIREYHQRGISLSQIFGMTETSTLTWLATENAYEKISSVGKPVFHGDVRVINEQGDEITPGETGEIRVRGPILMSGYWSRPDLFGKVMVDGWYCTGDLATIDDEGYLYIIDRATDMYISGGENISPTEIEKLLLTNPKIFDVAIFGVPDDRWGEVGKAAIMLKDGERINAEEIVQFLEGKIGKYKIPKYIEFVDQIPRTASGKIQRYLLIEKFKKGSGL
ncbi:long-chain-fatty-acid--CoA ligase [Thermodesulfobacteriota bacterium]